MGGWECGGARGGRGYGSARVRVRPPPAALARAGSIGTRGRPGGTQPFGVLRVWVPARPLGSAVPRVRKRRGGVVGPGARSWGPRERPAGAARGERAAAASLARLHAPRQVPLSRCPQLRVAPVTPRPAAGAALGLPKQGPQAPRALLWPSGG